MLGHTKKLCNYNWTMIELHACVHFSTQNEFVIMLSCIPMHNYYIYASNAYTYVPTCIYILKLCAF